MTFIDEGINGRPAALAAERAVEELRRGRALRIAVADDERLIAAVETLQASLLDRLLALDVAELVLTPQRAQAVGLANPSTGPLAISLPRDANLDLLRSIAGLDPKLAVPTALQAYAPEGIDAAAVGFRLAKLGRLLPALVMLPANDRALPGVLGFRAEELGDPARANDNPLEQISRARVPLIDALDAEIVLFRQHGEFGQHLAIVIGNPSTQTDIAVRLHSACLTGDVLGSLRCDCGDQLKRAIARIGALGGGVLLYLDQEGRGIGLANKLRAYALQDTGLDTVDADQHLGFLPDERDYAVAAAALKALGYTRIRLLTNNPAKIAALRQHGIDVTGRLPLIASVTAYNQRYLKAKLDRAGHLAE
jgi:GTP cyclohydrolase II